MGNLVIVAIPREDDYTWKISSEKVPHLTLLFLGDAAGKPINKIAEFLEHATKTMDLGPFMLDVERRGTLGDQDADVVFFHKKHGPFKRLSAFRSALLKHNPIRDAYDSAEQFDEWTPHLTLGYPEIPARPDNRDFPGIRWVEFDRIALWYEDFTGPEYRLEYNDDLAEVSMSSMADAGREFIAHYGVKGMKWGVRKDTPRPVTTQSVVNKGLRSKTKIKAKGGQAQPATQDAVKAAAQRPQVKKSGVSALSNTELRELQTRLQLEQQVKALDAQANASGKKLVKSVLKDTGERQVRRVASAQAAKRVAKTGLAVAV